MPTSTFRNIIDVNKPYDTGYMFVYGNTYTVNPDYIRASYDTKAVPYIVYQEKGTKYFDGNAGFIKKDTLMELNTVAVYESHGVTRERVAYRDASRARASMISQGTITHLKSSNTRGGTTNAYVG
jgi:hypothetical protein